jgi:hypothetical protein
MYLILEILKLVKWLLSDTDGDGRPDLFDDEPENPGVK